MRYMSYKHFNDKLSSSHDDSNVMMYWMNRYIDLSLGNVLHQGSTCLVYDIMLSDDWPNDRLVPELPATDDVMPLLQALNPKISAYLGRCPMIVTTARSTFAEQITANRPLLSV